MSASCHTVSLCNENRERGSSGVEFRGNELSPAQLPRTVDLYSGKLLSGTALWLA